jgi:hypothetical protein
MRREEEKASGPTRLAERLNHENTLRKDYE